jgi:hypothetical protein
LKGSILQENKMKKESNAAVEVASVLGVSEGIAQEYLTETNRRRSDRRMQSVGRFRYGGATAEVEERLILKEREIQRQKAEVAQKRVCLVSIHEIRAARIARRMEVSDV